MTYDADQRSTEVELVRLAQTGCQDAMHDLISLWRPAVLRYCRFRLSTYPGGHDAADDAAQETCLAVASVIESYADQGAPFSAWVYAIAANKVADARRRYGHAPVLVPDLPEQEEPSATPEQSLIASVQLQTALSLVERLPAGMQQVLLQRASGATAKMVAHDLGMTPGAVDVAHHRAVSRIRQLVEDSDELRDLFSAFRPDPPERPDAVGFAA